MSTSQYLVSKWEDKPVVAIIGASCRFPGAENIAEYWRLLMNGVDAISEAPPDRWPVDHYYDPNVSAPGKINTRFGGFLKQVDQFDPHFFGISPREATHMDPQQRLMLELSWEALADAGQDVDQLRESATGVFFGASWGDYGALYHQKGGDHITQHTATGTHFSIIANRVSYIFGFRGPSMAIDTACSSSLVALHQACNSLMNGESTLALAGGVHLMLVPESTVMMSKFGGLSPDGRCRTFDARANGFVRGEGAGVVALKPLAAALADGDPIYCVVLGSAVNNDGRDAGLSPMQRIVAAAREIRDKKRGTARSPNAGLTVPSIAAQEAVLRAACQKGEVLPQQVQYVEAHGTGTTLGDPVEARALSAVYCADRSPEQPLLVGAVKTNIGHLEAAAGVAGLLKVALAIKHGTIPPNLHFEQPNPNIPFETLKLKTPTVPTSWPNPDGLHMAGVSSFGFGGTNCHVVVAGFPFEQPATAPAESGTAGRPLLLPLSARSPEARRDVSRSMLAYLKAEPGLSLVDLCYTAAIRSTHHSYRCAVAYDGRHDLIEKLESFGRGEKVASLVLGQTGQGRLSEPVFVFSGQGPQWWAMGRELFTQEAVYRAAVELCDHHLRPYAGWSLVDELMADESCSRLDQTEIAQPAIFALQVALAALCRSWGILPGAVVGHSVGEVAAAYVSGSLTLEDAVRIIYHRGRLMQAMTGLGKMAAVDLSLEQAQELVNGYADRLAIAAINAPDAVVISGDTRALEELLQKLDKEDVYYRLMDVDYAFHSPQAAPYQEELVTALDGLAPKTAALPIFSTVTGKAISGPELNAAYWGRNMREPVYFHAAVASLTGAGFNLFLELSAHPVLAGYMSRYLETGGKTGHVLPTLRRGQNEQVAMLTAVGALYAWGYPVQWSKFHLAGGRLLPLPPYPWQRERYWLSANGHKAARSHAATPEPSTRPLPGRRVRSPLAEKAIIFESLFSLSTLPYMDEHRLYHNVIVPGAHHISMTLPAVQEYLATTQCHLVDMTFTQALALPEERGRLVQLILTPDEVGEFASAGDASFKIYSAPAEPSTGEDAWTVHMTGRLAAGESAMVSAVQEPVAVETVQGRCPEAIGGQAFYRDFTAAGYHLGTRFQWIDQIWRRDGEAICRMRSAESADQAHTFQIHPGLLDSVFQLLCVALPDGGLANILHTGDIYIPLGIDGFHFYGRPEGAVWCHALLRPQSGAHKEMFVGDMRLFDESGQTVAAVTGLHFKRAPRDILLRDEQKSITEHMYEIQWPVSEPAPRASVTPLVGTASPPANWLIFANEAAPTGQLIRLIEAQGHRCLTVSSGSTFRATGNQRWQIDPGRPAHFAELFDALASENVQQIIYAWGVDATASGVSSVAEIEATQKLACRGLLHLVQALSQTEAATLPRLWIVTQAAQKVAATGRRLALAQATLWGLGRVIALEHPEMWAGLIDLDNELSEAGTAVLWQHLNAADAEDQAAFREGRRHVARLVRCRREQSAPNVSIVLEATYLITGGLGGLGLTVARWLVGQGARRLVLLGRRGPSAAAQEMLRELAGEGAEVVVMQADVTEEAQVAAVINQINDAGPPLRGVVHAAGVLHDGILLNQEWAAFEKVMAPKIAGAWNLHTQTRNQPLDFFILFSSLASLLGSAGQSNYAAANAFMDALAHERRRQGLPAQSINWGPWAGVGMANALSDNHKQHWSAQGFGVIEPEHGTALLAQAGGYPHAQLGIMPVNWLKFAQKTAVRSNWAFLSGLVPASPEQLKQEQNDAEPQFLAQLQQVPAGRQKAVLQEHIQEQAAQVLGLRSSHPVGPQKRLFELGLDSLMAVELQTRLQTTLDRRLSKTLVFDYPTIETLTNYLAGQLLSLEEPPAEPDDENGQVALWAEIEQLSEEEAEALLLAELAGE